MMGLHTVFVDLHARGLVLSVLEITHVGVGDLESGARTGAKRPIGQRESSVVGRRVHPLEHEPVAGREVLHPDELEPERAGRGQALELTGAWSPGSCSLAAPADRCGRCRPNVARRLRPVLHRYHLPILGGGQSSAGTMWSVFIAGRGDLAPPPRLRSWPP